MEIRATLDWIRRLTDLLDSDITAYTIKHAIGFVIVWWLARRWFGEVAGVRQIEDTATPEHAPVIPGGCTFHSLIEDSSRRATPHMTRPCRAAIARLENGKQAA